MFSQYCLSRPSSGDYGCTKPHPAQKELSLSHYLSAYYQCQCEPTQKLFSVLYAHPCHRLCTQNLSSLECPSSFHHFLMKKKRFWRLFNWFKVIEPRRSQDLNWAAGFQACQALTSHCSLQQALDQLLGSQYSATDSDTLAKTSFTPLDRLYGPPLVYPQLVLQPGVCTSDQSTGPQTWTTLLTSISSSTM